MAIDWTKPVQTKGGLVPLLSPPNASGWRCDYLESLAFQLEWDAEGTVLNSKGPSDLDLINKPETLKVWLELEKLRGSDQWMIIDWHKTEPNWRLVANQGAQRFIHPIEIPIPEGK